MRVGIVLRAALVEHRRQIGAAAEPGFAGDDEARVHVHRRHMRILRMRDQRNAGGPEARILGGAGNLLAEFRREFAMHGRAMHADLLEHAPAHQRHHAAAAGLRRYDRCGSTACARSGRRARSAERRARRQRVLHRLERRADVVAQRFEPGARAGLAGFDLACVHHLIPSLAFTASRSEAVKPCVQSRSNSATAAS